MPRQATPRLPRESRLIQVMQAVVQHGATTQAEIRERVGTRSVSAFVHSCVARKWLTETQVQNGQSHRQHIYRPTEEGRHVGALNLTKGAA